MKNLVWLLVGILLGGIVAMLYTPHSGRKMRKKLTKQAKRLQLELEAQAEQGIERLKDWKVNAEEMVENAAKRVNGNGVSSETTVDF
ncbi:MAG: YtxH domain-containing protein [Sphingobacteriales bacterium]|jgi:gas vesicle protein|nr:YtxH domain-containing protein [Sphingobacteriales bacterium]MBP9140892.1 YtxH domain-containing protein [Chitinophagales bacterium]MDA0197574.1 YtxH domain-containing protein [Bacteroidota bacterium]MBK6889155.1 YtxH domain-containing protein [Sphingobacteriales bacterium]MBK7528340.1 YtxH domain-containing protein [Sphingobacteriales bacterium]